jgi:hypothetical protein
MKHNLILIFTLNLILSLVMACNTGTKQGLSVTRTPVACAEIEEKSLRSLEFNRLSMEDMHRWLEERSPFEGVNIHESIPDKGDDNGLLWEHTNGKYDARFREGILRRINILWSYWEHICLTPTADEVIACFGEPELYEAARADDIDGDFVFFALWYLEKGIVVWSTRLYYESEDGLPSLNGSKIMNMMTLTAPNSTAEEMVRDVYSFDADADEDVADILKRLRPWPSSWEKVVVRGCLYDPSCPD